MAAEQSRVRELREIVKVEPAGEASIELARLLIEEDETRAECREVLFASLARDPHNSLARLLLSRSFYLDDLLEFSVRELVELKKHSNVPSLDKLINAFGAYASAYLPGEKSEQQPKSQAGEDSSAAEQEKEVEVVDEDEDVEILAEIDIDDDFLDALEELEDA